MKKHLSPIARLLARSLLSSARVTYPTLPILLALGLFQAGMVHSQNIWTGGAGTTNWSTPGNWSFGLAPTAGDTVQFDNVVVAAAAAVVDNIMDADFTIASLTHSTVTTNGFHTTLIPAGLSLNINGSGTDAISVGTGILQGTGQNTYSRFVGPGTLTVTNAAGAIRVMQWGDNTDHRATLDLSGLTNLNADVRQVLVATTSTTSEERMMAAWLLAETNFIHVAAGITQPGILVGSMANGSTGKRGTQQIILGQKNTIYADAIAIGGYKMDGAFQMRSDLTGGVTTLRGSAGGSDRVKLLTLGDNRAGPALYDRGNTSAASIGTFDSTGSFLDLLVTDLIVARSQTNNSGASTATLTFDQGTIDVDNLYVAFHPSPAANNAAFNATGTVNVNGTATLTVNNDLVLARKVGTNIPTATLNLASTATVNVKGNLVNGGGTSTINFNNGGTINMQPSGDVSPGDITISTLGGVGSILNAANVTNTTSLTPGGAATAGTLAIGGNFTLPSTASINFTLADVNTVGSGVNDLVSVTGNLALNNNTLSLVPTGATLAGGSYRLFNYSGTLSGTLSFVNPTRYNLAVDYSTASQVNLVNAGGGPGSVTWKGSTNNNWNLTTTNWNNNSDKFYQLDSVTFDNTGAATNVSLAVTLYPSTVTVNSSTNYFFTGAGRISAAASITKSGTGLLLLTNTGANDYTGPVTINGGTLKAGRTDSLGSTNSGTTVSGGGTLDLGGISLFNPGEFVTISGNGVGNAGAIINSGADQNNGLRYVALAGDATIASSSPGRWDIRGPGGSGSFSGGLFLNGFTLTKIGVGKNSLVDSMITNSGSIILSNGTLGITRTIVDGPGTISAFGTNVLQLENASTGYVTKPLIFSGGGSTFQVVGNAFTLFSPITNIGGLTIDNAVALTLTNALTGAGSLTKISGGNLTLLAPDTHNGATTISAGRLTLGTNSSIANTPSISLGAGVVFDASAIPGGFVLASGQTLAGSGMVLGDVTAGPGRVLIPGLSAGTLTFSNNLALDSTTNIIELGTDPTLVGGGANDLISVSSNLTLTGVNTLKIVPLGPLSVTTPYTVMIYSNTLSGVLANLQVISDNPRYTFSVVDPATTPNAIQISASGTPPTLLWNGGQPGNPTVWNSTVSNWLNGAATEIFFAGDSVKFDDAAITNLVTLAGTLGPGSMTVSNETRNYTFGATGGLTGGSLTKQGAAAVSFTNAGPVSYSAGVTLDAGTVLFANGSANNFGGQFIINAGPVTFANNGLDSFGGGLVVNASSVQIANPGANTYGTGIRLEGGTLTINQPLDVTIGVTISNTVSLTAGTLVKQAANALVLSGNNANFDGPILASAGMLRAGNGNALGNANGGTTVASGATLDINGQSLYNPGDLITIAGTGLSSTGAVINAGAAQNNALRALTLSGNATIAAWGNRWDVRGPGGSGSFSGAVNLGGFTLTKLGTGRISVVDANMTDPGSVAVVAGTLGFTRSQVDGAGYINMGTNLLVLENNSLAVTFAKPLIFSGGTIQVTGNSIPITSPITNLAALAALTVDIAANITLTTQGPITGPGSLAKVNTGTLILAETNDYTGGTFISAGTLQLGLNGTIGNLPAQPSGVLTNNGTLIFNRSDDVTMSDRITGSGGVQQLAGGTVFLTASNSYSGQTLLNTTIANSPGGAALRISHSWALGDTVGNTRIVGNSAANTRLELVGDITVPEPFLLDARQGTDGQMPAILNVSGTNRLTGNITGNTGGSEYNIQSDGGRLIVAGNFVPPSTAGTRRLKLMGDGNGEWSGVISNSADTLVVALLTKTNLGTWTLSGSNVYRGNTTIAEGTLALAASGSINSTPTIDVKAGATFNVGAVTGGYVLGANQTLMGNGTVIGNVTANGTVSPGASIGTLTFANNLVLAGTNVMEIDRDATPNADLIVANALTYGGALVVNNLGQPLQAGDTFNLFDFTTRNGSFAATTLPALDPGLSWDTSSFAANGTIKVIAGTPSPSLTFQVTGNALDISWPNGNLGWRLEGQTNAISVGLSTNWFTVPNSTTTNRVILPIDPANRTTFYRLANP